MAGDWIKMRMDLKAHPKVVRIASALKADRLRIIGGLYSAWCLFDNYSADGRMEGYTPEIFDEEIGLSGLAAAMISVGWLEQTSDGLVMPRFDAHNGQSAKRRAQDADRKREERKIQNSSADEADKKRTREEKRREEIKKINGAFDSFWDFALTQYRKCDSKPGNKKEAEKEWDKLNPDETLQAEMRKALEVQADARVDPSDFVANLKHVCRWIKNECWNDVEAQQEQEDSTPAWMRNAL